MVDENGKVLEDQRGTGELQVCEPTVFKGYRRHPELIAERLDIDDWLHTGDMVNLDNDSFVYLLGRSKDMVKTGGENVAALEVENCLASHQGVRQAAVFGLPHEFWGEELVITVVPAHGSRPEGQSLQGYCRRKPSRFNVPKRIFLVDSRPQPSSGKVQKFALKRSNS